MLDYRAQYPLATMCRVLEVNRSGYYRWLEAPLSARSLRDEEIKTAILPLFETSRRLYGSPRVHRELRKIGICCSEKRVARLMREMGLIGRPRRRSVSTTDSAHDLPRVPNRLERKYAVADLERLNQAWAGDMTYIRTNEGWLYLAVVIDLKSRFVIGWSMADTMETGLVQNALGMATSGRLNKSGATAPLLFHSDQGSQYAAKAYRDQLEQARIDSSMSRRGNCWDNAPVEAFFATLKKEVVYRENYLSKEQAKASLFEYIEVYYNRLRSHSALGYLSPADYELSLRF
jgi:transposase InsO family protein